MIGDQKLENSLRQPFRKRKKTSLRAHLEEKSTRPHFDARFPVAKALVAINSWKHRRGPSNGALRFRSRLAASRKSSFRSPIASVPRNNIPGRGSDVSPWDERSLTRTSLCGSLKVYF